MSYARRAGLLIATLATCALAVGRPASGEAVTMTTTVLVRELTAEGPRTLSRHRVRLLGPEPVEVILGPGTATPGQRGQLRLELTPRSRSEEGAILAVAVAVSGVDSNRQVTLELAWDDEVRIAGFGGTCSHLVVDIKPER